MTSMRLNHPKLRDRVYDVLRTKILRQEYEFGARLDLEKLEDGLGVSRTPLKEALQQLASEGLVEIRPRRGTYVARIDATEAVDLFNLRQILECGAVPWIVTNATDDDIERITALNDGLWETLASGPYAEIVLDYIEADRRFHTELVALAGNRRLDEVHASVNTHLQVARVSPIFVRSQSDATEAEHKAIVVALQQRNADDLDRAFRYHVDLSRIRTLEAMDSVL